MLSNCRCPSTLQRWVLTIALLRRVPLCDVLPSPFTIIYRLFRFWMTIDTLHVKPFPLVPVKTSPPPDLSSISPTKFNSISLLQQIIASNTFSRAFAISYTSSRACYQVHVSRVAISYTFSRAFYQFHDFPRLLSVTCFSRLAISYMFVNPDWFSTLQS